MLKIPIHINEEKMYEAGLKTHNCSWSDEELVEQIRALRNVVAYLRGRKDSDIMLYKLNIELNCFYAFKEARERY